MRLSVWERIEASAQYQILLNTIMDSFGQAILGVPAAHHDVRTQRFHPSRPKLVWVQANMVNGGCVEKSKHNRVIENLWFFIDELVDSTQYCSMERSIAGMTFRHTISPKNAQEILERNNCCDAESLASLDDEGFLQPRRAPLNWVLCVDRLVRTQTTPITAEDGSNYDTRTFIRCCGRKNVSWDRHLVHYNSEHRFISRRSVL
jgi:hypothetical protein